MICSSVIREGAGGAAPAGIATPRARRARKAGTKVRPDRTAQRSLCMGGRLRRAAVEGSGCTAGKSSTAGLFPIECRGRVNSVAAFETSEVAGTSPDFADPLRILVVEDDPESLQMMGVLLGIWGHETTLTEAGPAALAAVGAAMPDVILLDLGLPGMDGFEVARSVRRLPGGGESVPIVAVTAFRGEEHQRQAREAGFNRYLMKPVDLDSLRQVLAQIHPHPQA